MSTIIDYASPASRSSLRLPARSEIRWENDRPGRLRITQVLAGRDGAVAALLLAAFTLFVMTSSVHGMIGKWHRYVIEIAIFAGFMAAELIVGALVIKNTWRKTVLIVTPHDMTLAMTGPFSARQQFTFPGEQIAGVSVVDRVAVGEAVVAELEIRMWSIPPVRLFAGHPHQTLMSLAAAIGEIQPLAPPPLPATAATPTTARRAGPPAVIIPTAPARAQPAIAQPVMAQLAPPQPIPAEPVPALPAAVRPVHAEPPDPPAAPAPPAPPAADSHSPAPALGFTMNF